MKFPVIFLVVKRPAALAGHTILYVDYRSADMGGAAASLQNNDVLNKIQR